MRGIMVRRGAPNTGSHENMEMIKAWIRHCDDDHSDCKTSIQMTPRLPTRLLQIEKSGKSFKMKLCLSSSLSPSTSYATLSHVWGSGSPTKLVDKNVLQCQQGISLASLPQTFADAIQLTNALGLSYLWIDSLCIIQDSTRDWEVESTTMCDLYRGSTINIAASASVDCNGGLFRKRNPLSVTPCTINLSYKQTEAGARGKAPYALFCETAFIRDPLAEEPLSRRAWAVQERVLAPRTVYFTARKIYFMCCKKMTSDVDPCSFIAYNGFKEDLVNTWTIIRPAWATHFPKLEFCSRNWMRVVQQYTHGQLSHESDKLVAIAGLAEHMHRTWLDPSITYLAGLWSFELIDWLMWRRPTTLRTLARPKAYRAPTWSWASVEGVVEWDLERVPIGSPDADVLYRASIVKARTSPTSNPFGSVQVGYIQVRGYMCTVEQARYRWCLPQWDILSVNGRDDPEHILAGLNEPMLLVLRVRREGHRGGGMSKFWTEGLLLEYSGDKKGQYKRVGQSETLAFAIPDDFRSFRPAEHLYMEVNANNEYTVEII